MAGNIIRAEARYNDLSWPRVPHGPEAAVNWRPPRAKGATAPRAAVRRRRHRPWLTKGVGLEEGVAIGQRERVAVGARGPRASERAKGHRECPRAKGPGKFPWSKVPSQPGTCVRAEALWSTLVMYLFFFWKFPWSVM